MRTADFDFHLPPELIAQTPCPERDQARLLVLHRHSGVVEHRHFPDLAEYMQRGDVLVLNNSRVIPARLQAVLAGTGGRMEILLLEQEAPNHWWAMMKPGKRARVGSRLLIQNAEQNSTRVEAVVTGVNKDGHRRLRFEGTVDVFAALESFGEVPLPPYIQREKGASEEDRRRYQTVYAEPPGSVAAPTAGLHFTDHVLSALRDRGVELSFVTLHVGAGTFAPVKSETLAGHRMHEERFEIGPAAVKKIRAARERGNRIFAVGTTTLRVLESVAARTGGVLAPMEGRTSLFVYPPCAFRIVDCLLTNFHLPRSTLLMLVSAFASPNKTCGRELTFRAYAEAIQQRYRFFSYGDAMLLL